MLLGVTQYSLLVVTLSPTTFSAFISSSLQNSFASAKYSISIILLESISSIVGLFNLLQPITDGLSMVTTQSTTSSNEFKISQKFLLLNENSGHIVEFVASTNE